MSNQFPKISSINRQNAIKNGENTYISGTVCKKCGSFEKYVSNQSCRPCSSAKGLEKLNNPELMAKYRTKEKKQKWIEANREAVREIKRRHARTEKGKLSNKLSSYRYRAMKYNQIPEDADHNIIAEIYKKAEQMTKETGIVYHVDHVIPISKGGLHHQDNLQIITAEENWKKGNRICD